MFARQLIDHVRQIVPLIHLAGDLVEALVAEHVAVLCDGAPDRERHVVGLAVVVPGCPRHGRAGFVLAREPCEHRLLVVDLVVHLAAVHPEPALDRQIARVLRIDRSRRKVSRRELRHQQIELAEECLRHERADRLALLLDGAEEEHLVVDERAAVLLAAERRLGRTRLRGVVVLRDQFPVALVAEQRAVELVRARLGDHCHRRAARTSVSRRELVGRELELLEALGRVGHQRAAVVIVAVVRAVHPLGDVAARRAAVRDRSGLVLRAVERGRGRGARQQFEHAGNRARDHRQVLQLGCLNRGGHLRLRGLDERCFAGHRQRLVDAGDGELEVDCQRGADQQVDVVARRRLEAGQIALHLVRAGFQTGQRPLAVLVGDGRADHACRLVRNGDGDTG